jgi:hypothetical protein
VTGGKNRVKGGLAMNAVALNLVPVEETTPLALDLPDGQSFEEWSETGRNLASAHKVLNWWIGDWWAAGSHRYGERARLAAEGIFGREFGGLMNLASVSRAFPTSRRREGLSFSHHQEVAGLPPVQADRLLDRAEREGWSTRDLRAEAILARSTTPRWFETRPPTQYDRDTAKEAIFQRIDQAAQLGEICPTADELAEVAGVESVSTTVALMHMLEDEGRIEVARFQKSRQVTIVATGRRTAEPTNTTPHWREVDKRSADTPTLPIHTIAHTAPNLATYLHGMMREENLTMQAAQIALMSRGVAHREAERTAGGEDVW